MTTGGNTFWSSGAVPLIEPEFLSSIIAAASDIALVVSAEGIILSVVVNSHSESFGNLKHWEDRPVSEFLTRESIPKFEKAHAAYLLGEVPKKQLELNHSDNAVWQYPVRYTFHRFGHENAALLLGRDLRPIAETQQQLVQAQIALEQGYEARREFDARYRVLLANTKQAVVFVSVQSGRVEDANEAAAALLGLNADALRSSSFAQHFMDRSNVELTESLMNATLAEEEGQVTLTATRTQATVIAHPVVFRAGGQRVLMCRLETKESKAATPDAAADHALAMFRAGSDAMLFMGPNGVIISVNESFLDLVGAAHLSDVVGRSFGDFLGRGQIDLAVLTEQPQRSGHMRIYATKLVNDLGTRLAVEISATHLADADVAAIGCMIRDVSRTETARGGSGGTISNAAPAEPARNVMDLVGSAALKDIVAETTDVVEKMCIETAVELTNNNRVAAAEMLGLSRQSLYVKLRKYGLLNKNG
ncbi:transcriptional regulator PpsR [Roseobacter denitrificans]|uniref:Transcriptional regulator PpsR n=1 Tax=Roseobacter denitrificans (strain ATCC 33942 / OCh 114) TaxID=375451 RepID=Q16DR6_ROSDO|nr:transcriptional regulator PpsR [Roseobacter denitrificans]ABG29877.1 transcriptional regulator PpsR [Roseobacter denitrificans OCh 114]AVL53093.1 transcriptional regulator PpsR [Roseobacter denitrificans]SFG25386.1 transcriptional regulator PpsR [Roseobacter denitrificans OCh 114]